MRTDDAPRPVGIFDSGVGGLSVLREVLKELPSEPVIYVADSSHAPYGDRSEAFILKRSRALVEFLIREGAKAIVVACNTATGVAIASLRDAFDVPLVGIEPAVKPAAGQTRSGVVGVLATSRTLSSAKFTRLVERHAAGARVIAQACPGLVERVEAGDVDGPDTRALVETYVRPLLDEHADTIVLGCTHYVSVIPLIRAVAGADVAVIDPAQPVARELSRQLQARGLATRRGSPGPRSFWTSGDPALVGPVMSRMLGDLVVPRPLPNTHDIEPDDREPDDLRSA